MNFNQLAALYEAKGTKPGERFHSAKNQAGPAGIGASPVGKDNYNPEMREVKPRHKDDKGDVGVRDIKDILTILSKGIQLLKNDDVFEHQMKGVMNGFKKNRSQISAYQESVLKSKPKVISNGYGEIARLTKIVNNPEMQERSDYNKYVADLNKAVAQNKEHEEELEAVYNDIDEVTLRNEKLNNEYLEQLLTAIKHTTNRLYTQLSQQIREDGDAPANRTPVELEDLSWEDLQGQLSKNALAQLQLLEMLMAPDKKNPLIQFMELQEQRYDEAKNRFYQLKKGDNYSVTTSQLYENLPLFTFVKFFSHAILNSPKIALTTKQKKLAKDASSDGGMLDRLNHVSTENQFEALRPDLLKYIDGLELQDFQKEALRNLANGKFQVRKGAPNAAFKIRSSLKSSQITESFDDFASRLLRSYRFDTDDYKLDLIEVLG